MNALIQAAFAVAAWLLMALLMILTVGAYASCVDPPRKVLRRFHPDFYVSTRA